MATRLDRLLLLLDTGSTPVIRKAAATQLGEVQKLHPHELPNLLARVHTFLKSDNWDTRIAGGQAIEAIANNVPMWDPPGVQVKAEAQDSSSVSSMESEQLEFSKFDIKRVLQHGEPLVGSSGAEYELPDEDLAGLDPKEKLMYQKKMVRKRLGLDIIPGLDVGMDKLFEDEDLLVKPEETRPQNLKKQSSFESAADAVAAEIAAISSSSKLSAREKNRAKRKAKLLAKQRSKDAGDNAMNDEDDAPSSKKRKTASVLVEQPADSDKIVVDNVTDVAATFEESGEWPFEAFSEELCQELFHQSWEVRHGAATGLREIIKVHGKGAGKAVDTLSQDLQNQNMKWMENMAVHLLCVLALDRFGDFVSDEVVAPVRETCAQTLGVVLKHMDVEDCKSVMTALLTLQDQIEWEVRHGGLLGIKYLLAVRQDLTTDLIPLALHPIMYALQDDDDDVRALAASALLPVIEAVVKLAPDKVQELLMILWDTLIELDDLTASTNSIMSLLAGMLACPSVNIDLLGAAGSLTELVPRLWPFLRHTIKSVRLAALRTLKTLLVGSASNKDSGVECTWLTPIMQDAFRHIFQRFILEPDLKILEFNYEVWCELLCKSSKNYLSASVVPFLNSWIGIMMLPPCVPIESSLLLQALHKPRNKLDKSQDKGARGRGQLVAEPTSEMIAGVPISMEQSERETAVLRARLAAAKCLGLLASYLSKYPGGMMPTPLDYLMQTLVFPLMSTSGTQRMCAALILEEWSLCHQGCQCPPNIIQQLNTMLSEQIVYDEIAVLNTRLQTDCQSLLIALRDKHIDAPAGSQPGCYTVDTATQLATTLFTELTKALPAAERKVLEAKRRHLIATVSQMQCEYNKLHIRVQCSIACTLIALKELPSKLNPVIRPVMDSIKKEEQTILQKRTAGSLACLLQLSMPRAPCPNPKIIKNICSFACCDPSVTPTVNLILSIDAEEAPPSPSVSGATPSFNNSTGLNVNDKGPVLHCDQYNGILTLVQQHKNAAAAVSKKGGRGKVSTSTIDNAAMANTESTNHEDNESSRVLSTQRRGAEFALIRLAKHFGESVPSSLPKLWETMVQPLGTMVSNKVLADEKIHINESDAQVLVNSLQVLELLTPHIEKTLLNKIVELLPNLLLCLQHPFCAVRHMSARCVGVLSTAATQQTLKTVIEDVIPLLASGDSVIKRQGAVESVNHVIEHMGINIVPYVVLLVVPVLGCMSDQCEDVRLLATHCFATLIRLMPLEAGIPDPPHMSAALIEQKQKERVFLEQLLDAKKLQSYTIPVPIKAELRKYQQDGVNWLAFLNKYKLHGILCDDMGLGKTLQSICIMAGNHHNQLQKFKETANPDCKPLPSIVICPPTLTGHWVYEVEKFVTKDYLKPLHYTGSPIERQRLRSKVKNHNLVVASYDIVRNDSDFFKSIRWNYCILDEGHIIKNGKTKLSKVIKQLQASHRLILSGTPIQNNVLELWSLFDFLMPGFLGTEKQFQARYGKPILQSRDAKSSSKEQEAGALAMEALHRQVLPFILRRLKEDVLQDLPPKIIQDYYCELSPIQVQLYEDFAKSQTKKGLSDSLSLVDGGQDKAKKGSTHIFQALQYLRKVCNHPLLVLTPQHPEYEKITEQIRDSKTSIRDIHHAAKLVALKQLLLDCGIGISTSSLSGDLASEPVVSQHRVLLFCQMKSMLDIVENDLLKCHLPSVTYLRLDGTTPAGSRQSIVHRFNDDPSIDVLLLTTHVGGLGLNLTGADTVIFVEHDWNPMKDLQAMDRAHRIGQKKVVSVYRLITKGTLEEKIMGLQKFKLTIANTVISQDNSSLQTMDTGQLLDLFSVEKQGNETKHEALRESEKSKVSLKSMLEDMGKLWDEDQYEAEYNLDNFIETLK
ncbi:TATA-binding protein-associated factor 172-like [Actinia tenebrosa]|uniref:TATA-binding protein-associated factor 172-like n=1 Tax=Actinia tenebrosa TaxID=6105 RepID=A0A6P8HTD2_ACTTE|nr:TATA-binding protein-associated factor 172-like [Actinia tenebrosa]